MTSFLPPPVTGKRSQDEHGLFTKLPKLSASLCSFRPAPCTCCFVCRVRDDSARASESRRDGVDRFTDHYALRQTSLPTFFPMRVTSVHGQGAVSPLYISSIRARDILLHVNESYAPLCWQTTLALAGSRNAARHSLIIFSNDIPVTL